MDYSITAPAQVAGEIDLPASKSISNRVLIVNALSGGLCDIKNIARCDDTHAMTEALASGERLIDIGAAGTAMRFLTAYFSLQVGRTVTLDGTPRMRQRPIKTLADTLNSCGADIRYVVNDGYPPLEIHGCNYHCSQVSIDAAMSSQFISAILMIAPVIGCTEIMLKGKITSRPYIDMTLGIMADFGVESRFVGNKITLDGNGYTPPRGFLIENDWSAASYWYELQSLLPVSRISLKGLFRDSLQGDARVCDIFKLLGVESHGCGSYVDLRASRLHGGNLLDIDMSDTPDLAQTVVVTACLQGLHFNISGLQTLKIKETDRMEALRSQLLKLGYVIKASDGSLSWNGETVQAEACPIIETFDDHRMAMAFAPAAVKFPGIIISDAQVVSKSYPDYWEHLGKCGFVIKEVR